MISHCLTRLRAAGVPRVRKYPVHLRAAGGLSFLCQKRWFSKGFQVLCALQGILRFYMSVVILYWVLGELGAGKTSSIRINVSSSRLLILPTISNSFEKLQEFCNARQPAPVHTASRSADTLFLYGFPTDFPCRFSCFRDFYNSVS